MPGPIIKKGSNYFNTVTYEGNGGGQRVGSFVPYTDNGTIAKSAIFESSGPAYLSKTYGSAGTSLKKFTFSCWFKLGKDSIAGTSGYYPTLFNVGGESGKYFSLFYQSVNQLFQYYSYNSTYDLRGITVRTFEDTSKWYHIVIAIDTTESTAGDRVKFYIDGERITNFTNQVNPAQDYDLAVGAAEPYYVGYMNSGDTWDGYIAEANYVDGTALTPSTFGLTDTSTGRWIPKTLTGITYGSNGFRMEFANSAGQTIGDDTSGNGNDFTVNNMDASDITTDSPTQNFTTLSGTNTRGSITLGEGNLHISSSSTNYAASATTFKFSETDSQGYYFEVKNAGSSRSAMSVLIMREIVNVPGLGSNQQFADCFGLISRGGGGSNQYWTSNSGSNDVTTGVAHASDDYIQVAFKSGKVWYGINNTWIFSGDPAAGTNPTYNQVAGQDFRFLMTAYLNNALECNFGQKSFNYTPPSGFIGIQQDKLPEAEGVSSFVWIKNRDATDDHAFYDSSRGPQKEWLNSESSESTVADGLQKFLVGGCEIEDDVALNTSGESYVAWNWVGNSGTEVANADGSGATVATTIQANDTAGFSICRFQGTGSTLKFAHGLSATPEWFITKRLDGSSAAVSVYHVSNGINAYLHLNETDGVVDSGAATSQFTGVSSTNITLGSNSNSNNSGSDVVAYVWRSVEGFSKFGSYTGTGNADGPFIYLGFKPAWIMLKGNASSSWIILDNKRNPNNPINRTVWANLTTAESTSYTWCDFLSNGFKMRDASNGLNNNAGVYVYMAFAEHSFFGNGTNPVTAR